MTVILADSWAQTNTSVQFRRIDLEIFRSEQSQEGGGKDHGLCKHADLRTVVQLD